MAKRKSIVRDSNIQSFNFNPNLNVTNQVSKALVPDGFDEFFKRQSRKSENKNQRE